MTSLRRRALIAGIGILIPMVATGHPLAPALLELRQVRDGVFDVTWRTSIVGVPGAPTRAVLPSHCAVIDAPREVRDGEAIVARWTIDCAPNGLVGATIAVDGLGAAGTEALVRLRLPGDRVVQRVLRPAEPTFVVPAEPSAASTARDYLGLGVGHLLTGWDHLLFIAGLLLLVPTRRVLLATITAFTVGHSVTLGLVTFDLVAVSSRLAELLIALSIFALAAELPRPADTPSWLRRRPATIAAMFGLLHGLGFAGALRDVGLPASDVPLALVAFNVGIELGQLSFVAALLLVATMAHHLAPRVIAWGRLVPAYAIGSLAAFWCCERATAFFR